MGVTLSTTISFICQEINKKKKCEEIASSYDASEKTRE
jgi:hypothetical protein